MTFHKHNTVHMYGEDNNRITIQEDGDGLGMVNVEANNDYYGKIDFSMLPDDAIEFAIAIIEQANVIKGLKR